MATTQEMLDEAGLGCAADGPLVQVGIDAYEDEEELTNSGEYCECGRPALGDHCQQCGQPLCPMCAETGAGFCKDHPDENYDDAWREDAYEDLRNATPEELLEAVIWFTSQGINDPWQLERTLSSLRRGFALAQPGGWEHVAPMWLRESRKE